MARARTAAWTGALWQVAALSCACLSLGATGVQLVGSSSDASYGAQFALLLVATALLWRAAWRRARSATLGALSTSILAALMPFEALLFRIGVLPWEPLPPGMTVTATTDESTANVASAYLILFAIHFMLHSLMVACLKAGRRVGGRFEPR